VFLCINASSAGIAEVGCSHDQKRPILSSIHATASSTAASG
jgi:hypothetical protein